MEEKKRSKPRHLSLVAPQPCATAMRPRSHGLLLGRRLDDILAALGRTRRLWLLDGDGDHLDGLDGVVFASAHLIARTRVSSDQVVQRIRWCSDQGKGALCTVNGAL